MRDDIKHHNLTFTEIAKLVGENWQSLPPAEKEAYESQANVAKEKYHRDLAEYKKTPQYRKYAHYLGEFKERQAKQNSGLYTRQLGRQPTTDVLGLTSRIADNKRPKLEATRLRHGSSSSSVTPGSGSGRGSRSSSERVQGSEPPPARQERLSSIGSCPDTLPGIGLHKHHMSADEPRHSPRAEHFEPRLGRDVQMQQQSLPSLSDVFDDGRVGGIQITQCADDMSYNGCSPAHRRPLLDGPSGGRVPLLRHPVSSSSSLGSGSSASSLSRPSVDGPLPIHALLSNQSPPPPYEASTSPTFLNAPNPIVVKTSLSIGQPHGLRGYGTFPPSV